MNTKTPEARARNVTRREARKAGLHLPRKHNRSPLTILKERVREYNRMRLEAGSGYKLKIINGEIQKIEVKPRRLRSGSPE